MAHFSIYRKVCFLFFGDFKVCLFKVIPFLFLVVLTLFLTKIFFNRLLCICKLTSLFVRLPVVQSFQSFAVHFFSISIDRFCGLFLMPDFQTLPLEKNQGLPKSVYAVFQFGNIIFIESVCVVKTCCDLIDISCNRCRKFVNFLKLGFIDFHDIALKYH